MPSRDIRNFYLEIQKRLQGSPLLDHPAFQAEMTDATLGTGGAPPDMTNMSAPPTGDEGFTPGIDEPNAASPMQIEAEDLDKWLVEVCNEERLNAIALSFQRKQEMARFEAMRDGWFRRDDPGDPLVQRGQYQPLIGKFIQTMAAARTEALIPDGSKCDFFVFNPKYNTPGIDKFVKIAEEETRQKFKSCRPHGARNFKDLWRRFEADVRTFGVMGGVFTHELEEIDNGDGVIEGGTPQWEDPFNMWPTRRRVNQASQTGWHIYDPLTTKEAKDPRYQNIDKMKADYSPRDLPERDPQGWAPTWIWGKDYAYWYTEQLVEKAYQRYVRLAPLPVDRIREKGQIPDEVSDEEITLLICQRWGLDPEECLKTKWWLIEYVGIWPIMCMPYPLKLPVGCGPVFWDQYIAVNGDIWGLGMFDRGGEMDERLSNLFMRNLTHLTRWLCDPAFGIRKRMIGPEWRQLRDAQIRVRPGDGVPIIGSAQDGDPIFPIFNPAVQAIPFVQQMRSTLEEEARFRSGATRAFEGNGSARSATEAANNLQQSASTSSDETDKAEQGILRELVERMYVITQQTAALGQFQGAPMSFNDMLFAQTQVNPQHLISLYLFDVEMTGSNSPQNKQKLVQNYQNFVNTWMPSAQSGIPNLPKMMIDHARMLDLPEPKSYCLIPDLADMPAVAFNLQTLMGQQAQAYSDPMAQGVMGGMGGSQGMAQQGGSQPAPAGLPAPQGGVRNTSPTMAGAMAPPPQRPGQKPLGVTSAS